MADNSWEFLDLHDPRHAMSDHLPGLRENPFVAGHEPRLVYEHDARTEVIAGFRQALASGEPFLLVTGDAGVGKTSIVMHALEKAWSAFITNPLLTRAELLEEICLRFGVDLPEAVSKPRLLAELERHLAEIRREDGAPVLVVDEAHNLSFELLEELRLLSNLEFKGRPLVQIVLIGLPTLEARLSQPDLVQLRQRIGTHLRVRGLGGEDTWRYLHHRVATAGGIGAELFPDETCIEIHRLTRGALRSINTLAAHAMQVASRESANLVTVKHVQAAAATTLRGASEGSPPTPAAAARIEAERPRPKPGAPPVASETKVAEPAPPAAAKESKPAPSKAAKAAKTEAPKLEAAKPEPPKTEAAKPASAPAPPKAAKSAPKPATPTPAPTPPAEVEPQTEPLPPRTSGEPEVREWISRFVDPDNPIQIGIHAKSESGPFLQDERDLEVELEGASTSAAPAPRPKPSRRASPMLPLRPRRGERDTTWITASAGAVLVLAALVIFVPRMRSTGSAPADSAAVAVTPSAPSPTPAQRAAARRRQATRPGSQNKRAETDTVEAQRWQGIEVATYLDPYRASAESSRLSELTGFSSRVLETSDADGDAYRVVLGSFGNRRKAERAADDLIRRGVIDQARVVPLGRKR